MAHSADRRSALTRQDPRWVEQQAAKLGHGAGVHVASGPADLPLPSPTFTCRALSVGVEATSQLVAEEGEERRRLRRATLQRVFLCCPAQSEGLVVLE